MSYKRFRRPTGSICMTNATSNPRLTPIYNQDLDIHKPPYLEPAIMKCGHTILVANHDMVEVQHIMTQYMSDGLCPTCSRKPGTVWTAWECRNGTTGEKATAYYPSPELDKVMRAYIAETKPKPYSAT
jgi:ribosomal protein L37AE/L43A